MSFSSTASQRTCTLNISEKKIISFYSYRTKSIWYWVNSNAIFFVIISYHKCVAYISSSTSKEDNTSTSTEHNCFNSLVELLYLVYSRRSKFFVIFLKYFVLFIYIFFDFYPLFLLLIILRCSVIDSFMIVRSFSLIYLFSFLTRFCFIYSIRFITFPLFSIYYYLIQSRHNSLVLVPSSIMHILSPSIRALLPCTKMARKLSMILLSLAFWCLLSVHAPSFVRIPNFFLNGVLFL